MTDDNETPDFVYKIGRLDGQPINPEARLFVLDFATMPEARVALSVYAMLIEPQHPAIARWLFQAIRNPKKAKTHEELVPSTTAAQSKAVEQEATA